MKAEEFIRDKIREKLELKGEMKGLWTYGCNGEDAMRWAHEFAELKSNELLTGALADEIKKLKDTVSKALNNSDLWMPTDIVNNSEFEDEYNIMHAMLRYLDRKNK